MKIHNIRLGFATNSSSAHSVVFVGNEKLNDNDVEDEDFGWGHFTAASKKSKTAYLAHTLFSNLRDVFKGNTKIAKYVAEEISGHKFKKEKEFDVIEGGYIDHQSIIGMPSNWSGNDIDREFAKDFKDFVLRKDVAILGGNDNDDECHPALAKCTEVNIPFPREPYNDELVARKDKGCWIVFNRKNGAKIRFSFDNTPYVKASVPELCDIKITNFCGGDDGDKGNGSTCKYCYMGSGPQGKHADKIHDLIWALQELKVFEVALGGGEPTSHPDFWELLKDIRGCGIVPNFSTKTSVWMKDINKVRKVVESCGRVGLSVADGAEALNKLSLAKTCGLFSGSTDPQVSLQCVMGVVSPYSLKWILDVACTFGVNTLLLGFKNKGRGKDYKPCDYSDWIKDIREFRKNNKHARIGVDTSLVKEFKDELIQEGIAEELFTLEEGKYSMYIDAVEKKMGPSSFCEDSEMVPIEVGYKTSNIKSVFEKF